MVIYTLNVIVSENKRYCNYLLSFLYSFVWVELPSTGQTKKDHWLYTKQQAV